jgi:HEAT repeat protein
MLSAFEGTWLRNPAEFSLVALASTIVGISILLGAILLRRMIRNRFLHRRDRRTMEIRRDYDRIIRLEIPSETWIFDPLDRQIIEEMVLDRVDTEDPGTLPPLLRFISDSGLMDRRIWEVRNYTSWRRQKALLALGRMRMPEGIPAVAEALTDRNAAVVVDAVRGLGKIGTPRAAEPILELLESDNLSCPQQILQITLVNCYRGHSTRLLKQISDCGEACRPLLMRVFAEVADRETTGDLLPLAVDPVAEVRACAARALGVIRPQYACTVLMRLAADEQWFVRLRAVVALGELMDPASIRALVGALCDSNRLVRIRAAAALSRFEGKEAKIFQLTLQTRDRYALQAMVSEMERSGRIPELVNDLADPDRRPAVELALGAALKGGSARMLLDLWLHHPDRNVRMPLARLLARSGSRELLQQLEQVSLSSATRRQVRLLAWLIMQLRKTAVKAASEPVVAA